MTSIRTLFYFLSLICICISCGHSEQQDNIRNWMKNNGKIKVLSTIGMIDDLVKDIAGPYVDSISLVNGELDPHSYQLVKGDDEKLAFADIIFYNGIGLEHGPSLRHHLHESSKSVSIGESILAKHPDILIYVNGQMDPHIWMDISVWAKSVPVIVDALSQKDPAHADYYKVNGLMLQQKMEKEHQIIREMFLAVPEQKRYLVTSHDAFNYFTRAYLSTDSEKNMSDWIKRFAAPEGLAPESQISTKDIQNIIDHLKFYHIHVIFPESNVSKDSIRKIVQAGRENGLDLVISETPLYGDSMGHPGTNGDTYLKMMMHNAKTITTHWK